MDLLDRLPGVWSGDGQGHYPTIATFGYREELTFTRLADRPVIAFSQRTWHHDDGRPLHVECGYVRTAGPLVELVLAQPTGFTEVHHGTTSGDAIDFGVTVFGRTATALRVQTVRRRWAFDGGRLISELWMSYAGEVDGHHLRSVLRRDAG